MAAPARPITIREVAAACGVSMMTVSRVVRGIDGVSDAVRARVAAAVREMGYVPNGNARAMTQAGTKLIGISLPNLFNDVFAEILGGMRSALHSSGYETVLDTTDYDPARELDWMRRVGVWRPAAVVLTGCHHAPETRALAAGARMAVMEIWDVTDDPIDTCVGIDHLEGGRALGAHAAGLGYRRPAFVGPPEGLDARADDRVRGLAEAFRDVGADGLRRIGLDAPSAFALGARGVERIRGGPLPDILFFHNDNSAFGGMAAAEAAGIDVPGEIGVAGFNGLEITRVMRRPLTTMQTPRRQIGLTAAQHLMARLAGLRPPPVTALPCQLVPGATTRTL